MIQTAITGLGATAHTIVCLRGFSVSLGGLDTWHLPPKDSCPGQGSAMDRFLLIAVIQSRVGCGQSRPVAALRQPIANDLSTPWCHRPRRDCSTEPGYPVNPPTVTLSVAALIAFGPMLGIVKKLAELHDFYPPGRRDSGRHRTEARVGDCWMTWAYSIDFRKRAFVRPILG